ncbi:MAG TPA: hypothetical protein VF746_02100 [Longimicrobium sp.]|jgi:hypothetical protein
MIRSVRVFCLAVPAFLLLLPAPARAQEAFVPGARVIFQEDFAAPRDTVFRRLRSVSPRIGLQARDGRAFLHARTPSSFEIVLPERLPERYTIEFDFFIPGVNQVGITSLGGGDVENGSVYCGPHTVTVSSGGEEDRVAELDEIEGLGGTTEERVNHCAIMVEGSRTRVWVNGRPVLDVPDLAPRPSDRLRVHFAGVEDPTLLDQNIQVWLTSLRIAAAR